MKIFITGATGFLGGELAKELRARGHELTALVRSAARAKGLPEGVRPVEGAADDVATFRDALAGHDAVAAR